MNQILEDTKKSGGDALTNNEKQSVYLDDEVALDFWL